MKNKIKFTLCALFVFFLSCQDSTVRHTINFNSNGGTFVPSQTVKPGEKLVRPSDPVNEDENLVFDAWYSDAGFSSRYNFNDSVEDSFTLYARWTIKGSFTVNFESNGGSSVPAISVMPGAKASEPAEPTLSGRIFQGWHTDVNLTSLYNWEAVVNMSFTLYAKWGNLPAQSGMYAVPSLQLHIEGNKILNSNNVEIRLTGVHLPSMEWVDTGENLLWSAYEAFTQWNCNVLRLGVVPDRWFGTTPQDWSTNNDDGVKYRELVDKVVELARSFGKYIILDNHEYVIPTALSKQFWEDAAERYKNDPVVLFGLLNEPHGYSNWNTWKNGGNVTVNGQGYIGIGHQPLVDAIRATGANNILVAGGLDWGYDLSGIAANNGALMLTDTPSGRGIMYDSHAYPWKDPLPNSTNSPNVSKVLVMKDRVPILVGEFGIHDGPMNGVYNGLDYAAVTHPNYITTMLNWMENNGLHFTAWTFHINAAPNLLVNDSTWQAGQKYTPTPHFGAFVKERLNSYPDSNSHLNPVPPRPAAPR